MEKTKLFGIIGLLFIISCFLTLRTGTAELSPIAKADNSALRRIQVSQQGAIQYKEALNLKPPFYNGSMPLFFISGKKAIGQSEMITVTQDFGKFKNTFSYNDTALQYSGIADGARTNDSSGRLLADAKLVKLIKGKGIHIEERHYGADGKVIFRCVSLIEFRDGFKKKEMEVKGKKQRDYYFLWPVTPF